jgi:hypothetical protein
MTEPGRGSVTFVCPAYSTVPTGLPREPRLSSVHNPTRSISPATCACYTAGFQEFKVRPFLFSDTAEKIKKGIKPNSWRRNVFKNHARFEVFMAVTMKNAVFWDINPRSYLIGNTLSLRSRPQSVTAMKDMRFSRQ